MNSENIAATPAQERIDSVEVQERLSWPSTPATGYCDTWLMVNAGALNFKASEDHQVAAMANIGHQLLQEIAAYRPEFRWARNPAEIVGALIEEMAAPTIEAKPQLAQDERAAFDAWFGDTSMRGYVHNEVSAFSGWLAAKRDALEATPVQPVAAPITPAGSTAGPTDSDMLDFLERTGSVPGSVREILKAAMLADGEKA